MFNKFSSIAWLIVLAISCVRVNADSVQLSASKSSSISNQEIEIEGRKFLNALINKDWSKLKEYEPMPNFFFVNGELVPRISDYVYSKEPNSEGYSSIQGIYEKGSILIMLDGQHENDFTLLFYVERDKAKMRNKSFLQKNFMKEYFACSFKKTNGKWKLRDHFCFDETDGPYPDVD